MVGEEGLGGRADGVDVCERRRFGAIQDLRRDVARRTHGEAHTGKARVPGTVGDPEVRELHAPPRVYEGVLGLYVAVDNALPVGVDEGLEDLG